MFFFKIQTDINYQWEVLILGMHNKKFKIMLLYLVISGTLRQTLLGVL